MKSLPLIILYYPDCTASRAYIEYLRHYSYMPEHIVLLRFISGKSAKLARIFGSKMAYSLLIMKQYLNKFRSKHKKINCIHMREMQKDFKLYIDFESPINLKNYAKKVSTLYISNFCDERLKTVINDNLNKVFLYTAGGIMPKEVLNIPNLKILHIHPGVVPFVKGSDGLYWSILLRGAPGASCFLMNEGIDTGEILVTMDFTQPIFHLDKQATNYKQIYKNLLKYYDPHLRGVVLIKTIKKYKDLKLTLQGSKQDASEGRTFFAMHNKLLELVINRIVK